MILNVDSIAPSKSTFIRGRISVTAIHDTLAAVKWFQSTITPDRRYKELRLLQAQDHPNIVRLLAAGPDYQNGQIDFLLTEFTSYGDLYQGSSLNAS